MGAVCHGAAQRPRPGVIVDIFAGDYGTKGLNMQAMNLSI